MWKHLFLSAAAFALLLLSIPATAQRVTASIRGTITDSSGGVMAGTKVTVKNEATGLTRTATTNSAGNYAFADLPTGSYRIEVEAQGFKSEVRSKIVLNVADVRVVDVQLSTGELAETVIVESPAVAVKTTGGEVAGLVTGEQVRELPLNGRNFLQLGTLMPGVSQGDGFNTKDRGLMSGIELAVSGSSTGGNLWT